ncbi:MAG: hypothetical protein ACR2KO_09815 [Geodermatophilaceae bacterium]|jgi:hypothetical protein
MVVVQLLASDSVAAQPDARLVEEMFLDLLCSDEEWLRAEFDAIIAAGWGGPRTARPLRPASPTPSPPRCHSRPEVAADTPAPGRCPGVGGWARQRSPPCWP